MKSKLGLVLFLAACQLSAQIEVTSTGNVGVGTTAPATKLDVQGDGSDSHDTFRVTRGAGNTARLQFSHNYIQRFNGDGSYGNLLLNINGGNVGIGTTYPGNTLDVFGIAQASYLWAGRAVAGHDGRLYMVDSSGNTKIYFDAASGAVSYFNGGNIGIGTTSPARKLSVESNATTHTEIAGFLAPSMGSGNVTYALIGRAAASGQCGIWGHQYDSITSNSFTWMANYGDPHTTGGITIRSGGNVGIGTPSPTYKLQVAGSVRAASFIGDVNTYADFVFKPGYKLASLSEVETAIQRDGRLPGIPSEAEAREHGIDLSAMQVKLLQKVEELTLYVIELKKEDAELRREIQKLKSAQP